MIALVVLPLLVLRARSKDPSDLNFVDRGLLRVVATVEYGVLGVGRWFGSLGSRYLFVVGAEAARQKLLTENQTLRSENERLRQENQRVAGLEALLGLRARIGLPTVTARVVGLETSGYFHVVRLSLQHDAEVKKGMAVLGREGVVGRVERVAGGYCDVLIASDPRSAIDITIARTKTRGLLRGTTGGRRYAMRVDYLAKDDALVEGDLVVTSTLGPFPPNLPVGKVAKVLRKEERGEQEAIVDPLVDYGKLDEVLIVLSEPPPPAPATSAGKRP